MLDSLFVYGSLAPGESNEWLLADLQGQWQPAWVTGIRHADGLPTTEGFPVLILADDAPQVEGLLFTSAELTEYWPQVDRFEGIAYKRVLTEVRLGDASTQQAYVYVLNEAFVGD